MPSQISESELFKLFASHRQLRTGLDMVLSHRCGRIHATGNAAVAVVDPFVYVAGRPDEALAAHLRPGEIVVDPPREWTDILSAHFPNSRTVDRQVFAGEHLNTSHLNELVSAYDIRRVDAAFARRIVVEVNEDLIMLPEAFAKDGTGFCAVVDDRLVAGATGVFWTDKKLEIQVNTAKEFQNRGFGTAVSAALIIDCLSRNIKPGWETENPLSARLAKRLGYIEAETYHWKYLDRSEVAAS